MDADGIYRMVEYDSMCEGARCYWDFVNIVPGAPLVQTELNGFYSLDKWKGEGFPDNADPAKYFSFTPVGRHEVHGCGGVDKRFLAQDFNAIDKMVDSILPAMRRRGGYLVSCDHGVPEEVPLENYLHFRKRCMEIGN